MEKQIWSLPFILLSLFFFSSCSKNSPGCTDVAASNYNASANKDDGSCIYVGNAVFYTDRLSLHGGSITVTLDNGQSSTIIMNSSTAPLCASNIGGAILGVTTGTHSYTAKDYFNVKSSGTINVTHGTCTGVFLQ